MSRRRLGEKVPKCPNCETEGERQVGIARYRCPNIDCRVELFLNEEDWKTKKESNERLQRELREADKL